MRPTRKRGAGAAPPAPAPRRRSGCRAPSGQRRRRSRSACGPGAGSPINTEESVRWPAPVSPRSRAAGAGGISLRTARSTARLRLRESLTPRRVAGFTGAFTVVIGVSGLLTARWRTWSGGSTRYMPDWRESKPRCRCDREEHQMESADPGPVSDGDSSSSSSGRVDTGLASPSCRHGARSARAAMVPRLFRASELELRCTRVPVALRPAGGARGRSILPPFAGRR